MEYEVVRHPFGPLFDAHSRVLILGSIPSPKSREVNFFYGHPQNRFWPVLAAVLGEPKPETIEEKRAMALPPRHCPCGIRWPRARSAAHRTPPSAIRCRMILRPCWKRRRSARCSARRGLA